jgi:hypothetical protein
MFAVAVIGFFFLNFQLSITKDSSHRSSGQPLPASNRFSHSDIKSPFEQIFIIDRLPDYMKKKNPECQRIEKEIAPTDRICFVHVGKAGGSTVGCALGFGLHCKNNTEIMDGILPRRTTNMFHADMFDCHDESAYWLFVVRNPLERIKSAFMYERPYGINWLKQVFPMYYEKRKAFYIDCPFRYLEDWVRMGLLEKPGSFGRNKGNWASRECRAMAHHSVWGTRHYLEHMFFNYQFHLEGIPKNAKILTIRNEHMVDDWNQVEHFLGGKKDILTPESAKTAFPKINEKNMTMDPSVKYDPYPSPKYLSEESTYSLCRNLCNEIVSYKKILRRSLNLNYQQIEESISELRESCGKYADYEEGDCYMDMPQIEEKLVMHRGYVDKVHQFAANAHVKRLEDPNPTQQKNKAELDLALATDDDSYPLN